MSEHPIYFERTSDGQKWPACGCGEVQLMSDGRSASEWIAAHHAWKGAEACVVCGKPSGRTVSHWECERQLLEPQDTGASL